MTLQELLDHYSLTIVNEPSEIRNYTKLEPESSEGYRYYLDKNNLNCAYRRNAELCKYFRNPYTEHNLSNFLKLETNGDVVIKDFQDAQNAHSPILLHCNSINLDYTKSANEITSGRYYIKSKMPDYKNPERLGIEYVKTEAVKYGIEIVDSEYINNMTPLKFVCLRHKDKGVQERTWSNIRKKKFPCKYCYYEDKLGNSWKSSVDTKERFEIASKELKNPFIDIIGEYKSAHNKIECKCLKCGETFYLRPDHIRRGIGHSGCNKSLGEERLEKYLKKHNINYIGQYRFGDCVRKERDMPFDFYLPDLNIAIEYDGVQHYEPVVKFGGEEGFAELKLNDYFKTNYCIEHNIKLIRVPYTEYDSMEEFLNNYFNKDKRS